MLMTVKHLRDFLDAEALKWLPGNLQARHVLMLTSHETDPAGITHSVAHIFTAEGAYMGTMRPVWMPRPGDQ